MVICLCKGVSDRKIRSLVRDGATTLKEVMQSCQAGSDCGSCVCQLKQIIEATRHADDTSELEAGSKKTTA